MSPPEVKVLVTRSGTRRVRRSLLSIAVCVLAIVAFASRPAQRLVRRARTYVALQRLLKAANTPSLLHVRLSSPTGSAIPGEESALKTATDVLALTEGDDGHEARHAEGLALLIANRPINATRELRKAVVAAPSARNWNDLAAAEIVAARSTGDDERLLAALVAVDRSLEIDPALAEALYNRALIIEAIGLAASAAAQFRRFASEEPPSGWRDEARRRVSSIEEKLSLEGQWKEISAKPPTAQPADLVRATRRFPQQARRTAESTLLADWAAATLGGDDAAAARNLDASRTIGQALRQHSGEALLDDIVSTIDAASPVERKRLAAAHALYRNGRLALRQQDMGKAAEILLRAARQFRESGSPMALIAEFYGAMALRNDLRPEESVHALERLLSTIDQNRHVAITAHAHHELALCLGTEGRWTEALEAANAAATAFRRIGEHENAAEVGIILIGLSSWTGQHAEALRHSLQTFRDLSVSGADDRVAAAVVAAGYVELRRRRWETAHALAKLESELPATRRDPLLRSNHLIRTAVIEAHLGRPRAADQSLARARAAAVAVSEAQRAILEGEIDAVAGAIARRQRKAAHAIAPLSRSIAFQRRASRLYALPELYLERGRAYADVGDTASAASDFDKGIAALEEQRSHTGETWRQIGIFDDAIDLFDEAAALALKRHDVNGAFSYVEARRGRALLDELVAKRERAPAFRSVDELRRSLPADTVLTEYVMLRDSMMVFVLTSDQIHVESLAVDAGTLGNQARAVAEALAQGDPTRVRPLLASLHASLFDPLRAWLTGRSTVIVVPDPVIQRVPFAALIDRSGHYAIEQHAILLVPSAAAYVAGAGRGRKASARQRAAAFGNPVSERSRASLENLPQAEREASTVARLYANATALVRRDVTKASFVAALRSAEVVHYAGHAIGSVIQPWMSALMLSSGPLTAREIVETQDVRARVVVLAACSTARSDAVIEGAPVLAHAFLLSGVPTVIGTLWDIEDGEATPLLKRLHARLAAGVPPANALRLAQLEMLRDGHSPNRNPSRWASFVAIGAP